MTLIGIVGLLVYPINTIRSTHTATTSDGVTISYNLYQPLGLTGPTPVVVMGHGIIVNKEMLTNFAMELVYRGYIVASLDWRGHGFSTGELDRTKLPLDLEAVIADIPLRATHANMSALALAGYSMGGWPTYQYALDHNDTVKAWVGIATSGNETHSNQTNPTNVLFVVGDLDEAFSLDVLKTDMVNLTGVPSASAVQINTLYGNMTNGTGRMLRVIPGVDHLMAPWTRDFVFHATNWIAESFGGVTTTALILMAFDVRMVFFVIGIMGLFGMIFVSALILADKLRIRKEPKDKSDALTADMIQDHSTLSFIGKYYGFTFALLPSIFIFVPLLFLPLPITAFLAMIVGCLGLNVVFYSWRMSRKYDISIKTVLKENVFQKKEIWLYSIMLGVLFFIGYEFIFGLHYLSMIPSINKLVYLLVFTPLCFVGFWSFGLFIQKYSTPFWESKLQNKNSAIKYVASSLINFVLIISWFTILILIICVALGSFFFAQIIILMVPIFLSVSFISVYIEKITGSIIPSAMLHAIFVSFTILTLTPLQSFLAFISIFAH